MPFPTLDLCDPVVMIARSRFVASQNVAARRAAYFAAHPVVRSTKNYLHESRHRFASGRERGPNGAFLPKGVTRAMYDARIAAGATHEEIKAEAAAKRKREVAAAKEAKRAAKRAKNK